jgi:heme/copper-type cytochrome/quinol oxidase subunit 2
MLSDEDFFTDSALTSNRLLTVDNHLAIPVEVNVRALVTSSDVIHA